MGFQLKPFFVVFAFLSPDNLEPSMRISCSKMHVRVLLCQVGFNTTVSRTVQYQSTCNLYMHVHVIEMHTHYIGNRAFLFCLRQRFQS